MRGDLANSTPSYQLNKLATDYSNVRITGLNIPVTPALEGQRIGAMEKILLLGDSLTERGFDTEHDGWVAQLSHHYSRKADVIARGYGGYNTEWFRKVLPYVLDESKNHKPPIFFVIFLGANDAVLPSLGKISDKHVPLERYIQNMEFLINEIKKVYSNAKILTITPPVFHPENWKKHRQQQGNPMDRSVENTKAYAEACISVSKKLKIPVVDIYSEMNNVAQFQKVSSGKYWENLEEMLCDGLHLSRKGNNLVIDCLLDSIRANYPHLQNHKLERIFPYHEDVDVSNLEKSIVP